MYEEIKTACLYVRYSSNNQTEQSIEGQIRVCREFCTRHDIRIVEVYADRATSASKDIEKRVQFLKMIKDSEKHTFDAVIVYKLDRFSRSRYDSANYKYRLKKNGVQVISATENISDDPEGIILESVLEGMAEFYSAELSQKINRGLRESAYKHNSIGGSIPLGYKSVGKKLVVDEETAPIVREAFEMYAEGHTVAHICRTFNAKGYKSSKGEPFGKSSFSKIFRNEKYIGVYQFHDYRAENVIPPIIDKKLFEQVQARLSKVGHTPGTYKARRVYLLSGKLFCGHCGEPMTGDGGTGRSGRVYNYYTCNGRRVHKCQKERAQKEWIEQLVVDELVDLIHSDDFVNEVADRCMEFQQREKDQSALRALEARQKENEKAIQNMLAAIEAGIITPSTKSRLMELEAERVQIEKGIAQQLISEPTLERDQVVYFLERFREGDVTDDGYRAFLVDTFLNAAYLYDDDKLVLVLNYTGERCKVTLELVEKAVEGDPGGSCFAPSGAPDNANLNKCSFSGLPKHSGLSIIITDRPFV